MERKANPVEDGTYQFDRHLQGKSCLFANLAKRQPTTVYL